MSSIFDKRIDTELAPAIWLDIGMGDFVDGIVLHQILQWHNMMSAVVPPTTRPAMHFNMLWDGFFHAAHLDRHSVAPACARSPPRAAFSA